MWSSSLMAFTCRTTQLAVRWIHAITMGGRHLRTPLSEGRLWTLGGLMAQKSFWAPLPALVRMTASFRFTTTTLMRMLPLWKECVATYQCTSVHLFATSKAIPTAPFVLFWAGRLSNSAFVPQIIDGTPLHALLLLFRRSTAPPSPLRWLRRT